MTFAAAAQVVLRASRRPMTAREIVERAIAEGLLRTEGKTPHASMAAALYALVPSGEHGIIKRIADPGPTRARRGSVRWTWQP